MARPVASEWPVTFGYLRRYSNGKKHKGIDFGTPTGTVIVAAMPGVVWGLNCWGAAYGKHVVIKAILDGATRYILTAHMSRIDVKVGQKVAFEQRLGLSGNTGNSTGPHTHFQVNKSSTWSDHVDPGPVLAYKEAAMPVAPIQWDRWKLTLPIGKPEKPTEVKPTASRPPYYRRVGDWLMFRAPVTGVTTSGSDYPRTELRELDPDGSLAKWANTSGKKQRQLSGTFKITELPKVKQHGVVAQIHDASDDLIEVRIEGKRLFVESDGKDLGTLDANYRLGDEFELLITAIPGNIRSRYTRADGTTTYRDLKVSKSGLYWKAGAYAQAFAGQKFNRKTVPADSAFEVGIKNLRIT